MYHALAHRDRVMDGCVVWVWWTPPYFFSGTSSSRRESMVGVVLVRASAVRVGLGVSGPTIVSGSCDCPSNLWISHVLTSSSSLGISSLFCRAAQCM
jgi:hypothetical protein